MKNKELPFTCDKCGMSTNYTQSSIKGSRFLCVQCADEEVNEIATEFECSESAAEEVYHTIQLIRKADHESHLFIIRNSINDLMKFNNEVVVSLIILLQKRESVLEAKGVFVPAYRESEKWIKQIMDLICDCC